MVDHREEGMGDRRPAAAWVGHWVRVGRAAGVLDRLGLAELYRTLEVRKLEDLRDAIRGGARIIGGGLTRHTLREGTGRRRHTTRHSGERRRHATGEVKRRRRHAGEASCSSGGRGRSASGLVLRQHGISVGLTFGGVR